MNLDAKPSRRKRSADTLAVPMPADAAAPVAQVSAAPGAVRSLHDRILSDIEQRIVSGEWPLGHRIPPEHELTDIYQCSRM